LYTSVAINCLLTSATVSKNYYYVMWWLTIPLSGIGCITITVIMIRSKYYRKRNVYILKERDMRNIESQVLINESEEIPEEELCKICEAVRKDCVFIPCGHKTCCYDCYLHIKSENCPICRNPINSVLKISDKKEYKSFVLV
jgi:hypothetical protein